MGSRSFCRADVDVAAAFAELPRLGPHTRLDRGLGRQALLLGVPADVVGDLHRAELRAAHRAEVRRLRALLGEGCVVVLAGPLGIEREAELVLPAELEAGL